MEKHDREDEPRKIKLAESGSLKDKAEGEKGKVKEKANKIVILIIFLLTILITMAFYLAPWIKKGMKIPNREPSSDSWVKNDTSDGYSL